MSFLPRDESPRPGGPVRPSVQPAPDAVPDETQSFNFPDSGNLKSASYQPASGVLEITFHDGSTYKYPGVEPTLYEDLTTATEGKLGSAGAFFRKYIRNAGYRSWKVDSEEGNGDGSD